MEFTHGQPEGADEAAALPSDPWFLHDFNTLLDNNLFNLSYDTPRLDEPLADPLYAEFDAGDMGFPENNFGDTEVTDTFPEPLADPSSAKCDAGDVAFPQHDDGEIPSTFTFSEQMISGFLADMDSATFPVPNPVVSTSSNALMPQAHVPGLTPSADPVGVISRSLITSPSTVIQPSGPANWMYTSHQGQNPHLYPLVYPLANCSIDNRTIDPSIQLGTCPAPGFLQSQPAATVQTVLPPFEGPQPAFTLHPPNSSTPPGPAKTALRTGMPRLMPYSAPRGIRAPQPELRAVPFRPITPKETSPQSSSQALTVYGPPPPPLVQATGQPSKSKRKRRPSVPEALGQACFSINPSVEATGNSKKRSKRSKYSKRTCLRCHVFKKKCSGTTFPCENCLAAWENKATKATLQIQACFDSDVTELDAFSSLWDQFVLPGITKIGLPEYKVGSPEWVAAIQGLHASLEPFSSLFNSIVEHTMVDAGLAQFLLRERLVIGPWWLDDGGAIRGNHPGNFQFRRQSLYWTLAVIHLHSTTIARLIGASDHMLWAARASISKQVFGRVSLLIRKFKTQPSKMTSRDREELKYSVQTIELVPFSEVFVKNFLGFIGHHKLPAIRRQRTKPGASIFEEPFEHTLDTKFWDHHRHLHTLTSYWRHKLSFIPEWEGTYAFRLAVLSRLDMEQELNVAPHPIDQAIKFLSDSNIEKFRADIAALQWEKQHQTLGTLERFGDYFHLLDTLKESMAAGQRDGASSNSPSRPTEQ